MTGLMTFKQNKNSNKMNY